ncbi:MAG: DUF2062 domain-containing protein [Paracoccaceae bacterium]|nr:DUF2062 domain-containing protein [Paracoccaceae bacterium]
MIFKRRDHPGFWNRLREIVFPRKGYWRGFDYVKKRLHRLPDSPHRIALGFACGALASFTPFFGFHFFIAAGIAWVVRGNIIAALFGTAIGNPLTFPLIVTASLWLGRWMLGRGEGQSDFEVVTYAFADALNSTWFTVKSWFGYGPSMMDGILGFLDEVFLPYLIGGILPGIVIAVISYWIVGPIVAAYQLRRRKKLAKRAEMARAASDAEQAAYRAEADNV